MIEVPWWTPALCMFLGAGCVEAGRWWARNEDKLKRKIGVK